MLLTYFLCGFIFEPAIHSYNLCAKKSEKIICVDYQTFMFFFVSKVDSVENEESMWKHSTKSWGM